MSNSLQASMRFAIGDLLVTTTLLYALIWLSDWFEFLVPLWLAWVVMLGPTVSTAIGGLVRAVWRRAHRAKRPTLVGSAR